MRKHQRIESSSMFAHQITELLNQSIDKAGVL